MISAPFKDRKSAKWLASVLLAVLLPSTGSVAQLRDRTEHKPADQDQQTKKQKKNVRGPRAIAVVEFLPGGATRLVPVALWINDHFYDASLYGAHPEPMALEPETMYQALAYGEPAGWFTVTTPRDVNGSWVADGQWKPVQPLEARIAAQAAKQPKPKPKSHDVLSDDQGPPVLRRPGGTDAASSSSDQASAPVPTPGGSSTSNGAGTASGNAPPSRMTIPTGPRSRHHPLPPLPPRGPPSATTLRQRTHRQRLPAQRQRARPTMTIPIVPYCDGVSQVPLPILPGQTQMAISRLRLPTHR